MFKDGLCRGERKLVGDGSKLCGFGKEMGECRGKTGRTDGEGVVEGSAIGKADLVRLGRRTAEVMATAFAMPEALRRSLTTFVTCFFTDALALGVEPLR